MTISLPQTMSAPVETEANKLNSADQAESPVRILSEEEWTTKWGFMLTHEPQAFTGLPDRAYREMPGWNASLLKDVVEYTPFHAWAANINPNRPPREKKDQFTVGSIFHTKLNEPEELENRYIVPPVDMPSRPTARQLVKPKPKKDGSWNTSSTSYQNWEKFMENEKIWADFLEKHKGKEIVTQSQLDEGLWQAKAVVDHPVLGPLYQNHPWNPAANELTLTCIDPITKSRIKGRIDALRIIEGVLVYLDTKGTKNAAPGPNGFGKEASNFNYLVQAAFYFDLGYYCERAIERELGLTDGCLMFLNKEFRFIAVEKLYLCSQTIGTYVVSEDDISLGRRAYRKALNDIDSAMKMGFFPGYSEAPLPLEIPGWHRRKLEMYIGGDE